MTVTARAEYRNIDGDFFWYPGESSSSRAARIIIKHVDRYFTQPYMNNGMFGYGLFSQYPDTGAVVVGVISPESREGRPSAGFAFNWKY